MAKLGFRTFNEMIGRVDRIEPRQAIDHWKAKGIDFSNILYTPDVPSDVGRYCQMEQDHGLDKSLDMTVLFDFCRPAIERKERVVAEVPIRNVHRVVGTIVGNEVTRAPRGRGPARGHHFDQIQRQRRPEFRGVHASGHDVPFGRRRQRLLRQGTERRQADHLSADRRILRGRGEHHHRQRGVLRGHRRARLTSAAWPASVSASGIPASARWSRRWATTAANT
jgi:hypothetical protein